MESELSYHVQNVAAGRLSREALHALIVSTLQLSNLSITDIYSFSNSSRLLFEDSLLFGEHKQKDGYKQNT